MIRPMTTAVLAIGLAACASTATTEKQATEKPELSAKEQVDGVAKMCAENADAMKQRQAEKSLYSRLGEREGIAEFSKRLYVQHKANEKIGHYFVDIPQEPFVSHVTEFLVTNSGGEGNYSGPSMGQVHANLNISHEDFLIAGGDVQKVMKELGAGENEIQEAVCFLVSFVPTVVTN